MIVKRLPNTRQSGATLLEVLVVLSIIALIAGIVGPRLIGYLGGAKTEAASLQIKSIANAVQLYYIDVGRYPSEAEGLSVLVSRPMGTDAWNGPYLSSATALQDPWSRDYLYIPPSSDGDFEVFSYGRDGVVGGTGEDADLGR